jgi:hypothetical protein
MLFLHIPFANKGIDAINISNILNRKEVVKEIPPYINTCSALFAKNKLDGNVNLIQVLVNPYVYSNNAEFTNIISEHLEPLCREKRS